jgi:hypothetical protein
MRSFIGLWNDPFSARQFIRASDLDVGQAKGAQGTDQWLPPNKPFRCEYISIWHRIIQSYTELIFLPKEKRVFDKQLNACSQK